MSTAVPGGIVPKGDQGNKRILVVDDEDMMREAVVEILRGCGYDVEECGNGIEALERLKSSVPDLILCDVHMPELDGFGLLQELRKSPRTSDIPFVFLTGQADRPSQREGMTLGADDYITKPFAIEELTQAVASRLAKHRGFQDRMEKRLDELRRSISLALPHEFRTPLTGILGFAEILEQSEELSAEERVYIGSHIHKSAKRLYHLLERMLVMAELESDLADPNRVKRLRDSSAAVGITLSQIVEAQATESQRKDDVRLSLVDARAKVLESHLAKAIDEVLSNALKFSSKGTEVVVRAYTEGARVAISVETTAKGWTMTRSRGSVRSYSSTAATRNSREREWGSRW